MSNDPAGVSATKPDSVLYRDVKLDGKSLMKSLFKGVSHFVAGKPEDVIGDLGEALGALGLGTEPGHVAWLLVHRALTKSMWELTRASADLLENASPENDAFEERAQAALGAVELTVDRGFFERPGDLPVVGVARNLFEEWLVTKGQVPARAKTVADRLPAFFVYELIREWREHSQAYMLLVQALETPFDAAALREREWDHYYAWLRRQVEEDMLGETFSLSQVYIPLRAYYEMKERGERVSGGIDGPARDKRSPTRAAVPLRETLDKWIRQGDRTDAIRVVSGGPGSGKSSFAKMYAMHRADSSETRVLFIPLYQFDPKGDLDDALRDFVREAGLFSLSPLDVDTGERRLLLIFDGLDELAMQGKASEEIARNFVQEVTRAVDRRNLQDNRLQVIISGREVVIQANESAFRKPGQVLRVLPYLIHEKDREHYEAIGVSLEEDQRRSWWQKYGDATGREEYSLPHSLQREDLDEITAQPLLNYLVALSYERNKLDFTGDINLNQIYEDLLDAVYERGYGGQQHPTILEMGRERFVRVLEEIGLASWHGAGRTTTVRAIRQHCEAANLSRLLEMFQEGAEAGVTRLLTAFYFRQYGSSEDGEKTFEFTHKSFGEYLTARRIVRGLRTIEDERQRRRDSYDRGWTEREALKHWAELCGPTSLDGALLRFLREEVRLEEHTTVAAWQQTLCELINHLLRHGMPMEEIASIQRYYEAARQAANAEEALLAALNACAKITNKMSDINWPDRFSAGAWLTRLIGQRTTTDKTLGLRCLSLLGLRGCHIRLSLRGADLSFANLSGAVFSRADLSRIDLTGSDLSRATLWGADLSHASLRGANLAEANLIGAKLWETDISEANVSDADVTAADLWRTIGLDSIIGAPQGKPFRVPKGFKLPDSSLKENNDNGDEDRSRST